jgi:hypothetical protein
MKTTFDALPFEARFRFFDRDFVKVGLSLAEDAVRDGHVFQYEAEVEADPLAVSPETVAVSEEVKGKK